MSQEKERRGGEIVWIVFVVEIVDVCGKRIVFGGLELC